MDGMNLLVTDQSPEAAECINSVLRNSGIKIHVIHASKAVEVKRALDQHRPILILYANPDPAVASLEEISSLAEKQAIPFALYAHLDQTEQLIERLRQTASLVIDADNESLLCDTVSRLARSHELIRSHIEQKYKLEELGHRYELLLDSARDAIAYIHEGLHVYANRAYLEALKVGTVDEVVGISLLEMMNAEGRNLKALLKELARGEFPEDTLEVTVSRPDGSTFEANLTFSPARFNGEECIQMLVHERDAASELAAELERMRVTDPLTQLSNKRAFMERLDREIGEKRSADVVAAVFYLEPDGFLDLADELDAASMDALLADFARVLKASVTADDLVSRVADHGFAVLTHQRKLDDVEALANKLLSAIRSHLAEIGERSISMSCSIGIAMLGRLAQNSQAVITGARKAQVEAAQKGNRFQTYRPQLTAVSALDDDRQWVDRIKYALANREFYSVQKPIVDLDGEGGQLVENLFYLRDESGDVAAARFMAIADRNDLAGQVDRAVLPELLKSFVEASDRQIISISSNSVLDYGFPAWLTEQLRACCVDGGKIIIQVSASTAQTNLKPVQRMMQELRPLGCQLSVTSFTPERRCRQLLEHIDVDLIKIHPSFTENLTGNSSNQEAVRSIVDAAEAREVTVIADEVTDTPSLAILWQCGVTMIAGAFLKENSQVVGQ